MKSFEEKFSAWIDKELPEAERELFERSIADNPEAAEDREAAMKLGELLRQHCQPPPLRNPDFFNQRIMEEIAAAEPKTAPVPERIAAFPVWRFAWAGALCLLIAAGIYQFAVPKGPYVNSAEDLYLAEIIEANPGNPDISVTAFHAENNNLTVLWLDGLEYLPETYALK